jgi:hypothetical protein
MNHLHSVMGCKKASRWSVDRIARDRNLSLTFCQGMRESKPVVNGWDSAREESITYVLSKDVRKHAGDQGRQFCVTAINDEVDSVFPKSELRS